MGLTDQGAGVRSRQAGYAAIRPAVARLVRRASHPRKDRARLPPAAPASAARAPAPPERHRHRDLPRDPYAIYARPDILGLDPLRRLDETSDARDKSILYHAALHGFFQAYPQALPENAAAKLLHKLDKAAEELGFNLENAPFWEAALRPLCSVVRRKRHRAPRRGVFKC